ncbi:MAG: glycosyltransferase [Bacteroidales bacterium]|nr:glycosyltransferase [Bacteroidales bacterium]
MISVIIPVYNVEKYLRQCLESILAQTFHDYETILVDDGSTDTSGTICDDFASRDSRIKVIHKPNGGLSSARNAGIDVASGNRIIFIDSDDIISPDCLETLHSTALSTGAGIICGSFTHDLHKLGKGKGVRTVAAGRAIEQTLHQTHGCLNTACGKLFDRKIFDGLRFREGTWYEDLDFFYRAYARAQTITFSGQRTYYYRLHPASFLGKWSEQRLDVLRVMEDMTQWFTDNMPQLLPAVHDRHFAAACNMFLLLSADNPDHAACDSTWQTICRYRRQVLFGRGVRLKNRAGAMLTYLGRKIFSRL